MRPSRSSTSLVRRSRSYTDVMTPDEKRRLREKLDHLKKTAEEGRAKRAESNKKLERAIMTLRELSGRA